MYSKAVLGTSPNKPSMSWWDYWYGHCWHTGWQTIADAFRIWSDLMTSNYKDYALLKDDDPEEECINWFWTTLGEDEVYEKEFLEYLMQMADDVDQGKIELIPWSEIEDALLDDLMKTE